MREEVEDEAGGREEKGEAVLIHEAVKETIARRSQEQGIPRPIKRDTRLLTEIYFDPHDTARWKRR
ncbi:hypothetical protein E2C01_067516 [Portunus trituberculatus]|uniref:Uncharacterized protein n=1 Tax=Portunus trituberculatus TaxID=210409 RepID=A0A5B7HTY4_PORTR|nr:hypothetical protein [Portunus trituberculatus]